MRYPCFKVQEGALRNKNGPPASQIISITGESIMLYSPCGGLLFCTRYHSQQLSKINTNTIQNIYKRGPRKSFLFHNSISNYEQLLILTQFSVLLLYYILLLVLSEQGILHKLEMFQGTLYSRYNCVPYLLPQSYHVLCTFL